ncbi:MAG: Tat pathway signal protein [Bacteroidetes bacterium]|nr:MAG: Tat pathway signal protein [Bacteroidota bacterium]
MKRRQFLKNAGIAGISLSIAPWILHSCNQSISDKQRNWVWITPETGLPEKEWFTIFEKLKANGFDGAFVQIYSSHQAWYETSLLPVHEPLLDKLITIGKETGIEVHAWMWTMPNNNPWYIENHPEFYAVNGLGQPSHTHPAYVPYYRFMCPNQPGVKKFITSNVEVLASKEGLDGIHFDYIRLPDVIIAEALQPVYNIVQDREYPEYDYCFCPVCRELFKDKTGIDPLKDLADPSASEAWRQFRYDSVTSLVNDSLIPPVKQSGKKATAAVFPNWESVRQQWSRWEMDAYFPMLYHNFYNAPLDWIGQNLEKQISELKNPAPVYSGLFIPSLTPSELEEAVHISKKAGASGVTLFSYHQMSEEHLKVMRKQML